MLFYSVYVSIKYALHISGNENKIVLGINFDKLLKF